MSPLPKLKLKLPFDNPSEEVYELEQVKDSLNFDAVIFLVEGKRVHSYDKLVQLATQDNYKNKEFIEVELLPIFEGG